MNYPDGENKAVWERGRLFLEFRAFLFTICFVFSSGSLMERASRYGFYRIAWRSQDEFALYEGREYSKSAVLSSPPVKLRKCFNRLGRDS